MPLDSSLIDDAVVARLLNDTTLMALTPDGVYFGEGPQGKERFVVVSLVDASDEDTFDGRSYEEVLYLVKAVVKGTTGTSAKAAAARIDALLADPAVPLSAAGYTYMASFRDEPGRVRYPEVDGLDESIRWQHAGAYYRVQMFIGS